VGFVVDTNLHWRRAKLFLRWLSKLRSLSRWRSKTRHEVGCLQSRLHEAYWIQLSAALVGRRFRRNSLGFLERQDRCGLRSTRTVGRDDP